MFCMGAAAPDRHVHSMLQGAASHGTWAAPHGIFMAALGPSSRLNGLVQGALGCSWSNHSPGHAHVHRATLDT